jgi:endonuclease YncB( thermonuclease family)
MNADVTPRAANLALAVSVAVVVAAGMSFALFYHAPDSRIVMTSEAVPQSAVPPDVATGVDGDRASPPAPTQTVTEASPPVGADVAQPVPSPLASQAIAPASPGPAAPANVQTAQVATPSPSPAQAASAGPNTPSANGAATQPPAVVTTNPAPAAVPTKIDPNVAVRVRPGDPIPPLPTVALHSHDVHGIAESDAVVMPVTLLNRDGRVLAVERERAPGARGNATANMEGSAGNGRTGRMAGKATPVALEGAPNLTGAGIVTATLELNVDGHPLRLHGLKAPENSDMCAPSAQFAARACPEVSREALAGLLRRDSKVECHVMPPSGGAALPAICADTGGADLGRALIARGLALADDGASADYADAERQARASHLGLWQYR